jgi:MFS family permease
VLLLVAATWVERRAKQPMVPIDVVTQRVPALAIVASLAVGMAMFGGAVFLGQYFQVARGYTPTETGLLTIPLMAGVLVTSTISGQLITRTGRIKPYIVGGAAVLVGGNLVLGMMDHDTPLWILWVGMLLVGAGVGLTMQNLVLGVQNAVSLRDLGAASGAVTFFRSLGGTVGVALLGAVLANRVSVSIAEKLESAGIPASGAGGDLDLTALPEPALAIVRASYGDATGHIFLISAAIGLVGLAAAILMPRVVLRSTLDLPEREPATAGRR